jgi:hypothetical protein
MKPLLACYHNCGYDKNFFLGTNTSYLFLMRPANADVLDQSALYSAASASRSGKMKGVCNQYNTLFHLWARVIVYIVQFAHFDASQSCSPETPTSSTA